MPNINELNQTEMAPSTLSLFNYVTQGISSDVDLDFDMLGESELNFD